MEIDYRRLLLKYITYVGECEGVTFISCRINRIPKLFTEDEWKELKKLDAESDALAYSIHLEE